MRTVLLAAALLAVPSVAEAQSGYIEGSIGLALMPNVETQDFIIDTGVAVFAGRLEGDYGSELFLGGEVGMAFGGPIQPLRFGFALDYASVNLDSATFEGTVDGVPVSETLSDDDLDALGAQFDNDVYIVQGNLTFDLPSTGTFTPFVGAGMGAAFIQNAGTEWALSASVGARFALSERVYLGGRYRFNYITEPTDDLGFQYDPILFHAFAVILGVRF
jgi:opacity protein-like surface antigen